MTEAKKGNVFYPGIDTEFDAMGDASLFGLEITKASDGSVVANGVEEGTEAWEEIMWTANDHTGTTAGVAKTGDSVIALASGNTLVAGDRFDDGAGNLYYVVAGSDESITIKKELVADIADAAAISSVGNTGLYKVNVQLDEAGEYFLSISHPDFGHTTSKYLVTESTLDEVNDAVKKLSGSDRMIAIN